MNLAYYALVEGFIDIGFYIYKSVDGKSKVDVEYDIIESSAFQYNVHMTRKRDVFTISLINNTFEIVSSYSFSILDFDTLKSIGKLHEKPSKKTKK